ncbi:MAG TPA: DUF2795 domain-containing protein [Gaiellaceae bacterium]|nr:DUF2795 domain-containing protein [Gaiellaceae bacterium]
MDLASVATLQVLLEGVPLPNERSTLMQYAVHEGASSEQLAMLRRLPDRQFDHIDEIAEALVRVQPERKKEVPHRPREESGDPPGGDAYLELRPATGQVRDLDAVSGD